MQRHCSRNLAREAQRAAVTEDEGRAGGARRCVAEPRWRHDAAAAGQPTPAGHLVRVRVRVRVRVGVRVRVRLRVRVRIGVRVRVRVRVSTASPT